MSTEEEFTRLHNEHAPETFRQLMRPLAEGRISFEATAVMLETIVIGFLLTGERMGRSAPHFLDALYEGVQARLEADKRRQAL